MSPTFVRRVRLEASAADAFAWHERAGAFARLSPPWQHVRVLAAAGGIRDGASVTLDLGRPLGRWALVHEQYEAGRRFVDVQVSGPFRRWRHIHTFEPDGAGCQLEDRIEYEPPSSPLGSLVGHAIERRLAALFAWRHRVTRLDLARWRARGGRARVVGVTGASGMIGQALVAYLASQGFGVRRFVRGEAAPAGDIAWRPEVGVLAPQALAGLDAIIHLAGAGIAEGRWTAARRRELVRSRVDSTRLLAERLAASGAGAKATLVSASASGWYGDRGETELAEGSAPGTGFLAELAQQWEAAAAPAVAAGVRVVHPRIGVVLWPQGGALAQLLGPARWGLGGPLGNGRQWWSWVTLSDLLDMLVFALEPPATGAFHAVAPVAVRQRELAAALGRVLARPAVLPAPAFALRALLGRDLANDVLLAGQRLVPRRLAQWGYAHRDPELEPALRALLGRTQGEAA